ncbi:MAG TPA: APC family permease [Kofleriaceae bacterium]|nr:APC family permease [Kofleriaceae bacterium]
MSAGTHAAGRLRRSVGFYGLMFVSLGSIIGSGWLLGALKAAQVAGPASILSWILAAAMLSILALVFAEIGAAYPVAGGAARVPYYSHGAITGFTAGWASWLQAVFIPPIEVLAAINYINSVGVVHDHFNMLDNGLLNSHGLVVAIAMMGVFTAINLAGAKFLSESNAIVVIWKALVPFLAIAVVGAVQFNPSNFHAGGGFMPYGMHGVFAALTGGVVFGLQGFEQAVQLAGEARDPKRDLARAVLTAMAIGAVLYTLLQIVLIGALDPADIAGGWAKPLGTAPSAYGAWYTLALALGLGWLADVLLIDAIISPAGTGVIYVGTSARLSYALGEEREMPSVLSKTNAKGVPVVSILVAAVVGCIAFGPFKSWKDLVEVVTSTTAIMYGFAPVSLAALHKLDPNRERAYRVPMPKVMLPAAFCSANLIIYFAGFDTTWKLMIAMVVGLLLFAFGAWRTKTGAVRNTWRNALWIAPWFAGHLVIGALGRYGGGYEVLPNWVDLGVLITFALAIYYLALGQTLSQAASEAAVAKDAYQLDFEALPEARVVLPPQ